MSLLRFTGVLAMAVAATASSPLNVQPVKAVRIVASDFKFDAPASLPAGVTTFELVNKGSQFHHLIIVRLDEGKTMQDVVEGMKHEGPPPPWFVMLGGPNAPTPGSDLPANATLVLEPGRYLIMCMVPTNGVPHAAMGMMQELTVTPAGAQKASLPDPDITMELSDYAFTLSQPLTAGKHTIRVTNKGPQLHEVELVKLAPGKSAQDLLKWFETEQGPPPGMPLGGAAPMVPGMSNNVSVDLTAGDYVVMCFLPDSKDGKEHFMHGMIQTYTVQ